MHLRREERGEGLRGKAAALSWYSILSKKSSMAFSRGAGPLKMARLEGDFRPWVEAEKEGTGAFTAFRNWKRIPKETPIVVRSDNRTRCSKRMSCWAKMGARESRPSRWHHCSMGVRDWVVLGSEVVGRETTGTSTNVGAATGVVSIIGESLAFISVKGI